MLKGTQKSCLLVLFITAFFYEIYFLFHVRLHHKANDMYRTWDFRIHSSFSEFILIFLRKESGRLMGLIKSDGCHGYGF